MITKNIIGFETSAKGKEKLCATNPGNQTILAGKFASATMEEIDLASTKSWNAWREYQFFSGVRKATFLRTIADEIESLGQTLIDRVMAETGLPEGRVKGERGRTCGQLRLFADLVEEGSWVEATVDSALPDREPLPKADIRKMLHPSGPVAVFAASNFPLAFSTAGGDTASALAAGCPVIVKAHSSHLGTNALVSEAIQKAAQKCGMPDGVFSSLQGPGKTVGQALVKHPKIKSVGFTGSLGGGMALWKAANERQEPIPVFAEMGSINPIFLLPEIIEEDPTSLAEKIAGSVNLGAGQFCTNPGLLVVLEDESTDKLIESLQLSFSGLVPATMLSETIYNSYSKGKNANLNTQKVEVIYAGKAEGAQEWIAQPAIVTVSGKTFLDQPGLHEEVFGPFTILVKCQSRDEVLEIATGMKGQLTASILGHHPELNRWKDLFDILKAKVGRIIFNGVPTGVEVCHSMQHGGPFPASTDSRFTSVGTAAIKRFARPVAYQDCPDVLLPNELKHSNPLKIWRLLNGKWSKD